MNAASTADFLAGLASAIPALPRAACREHRDTFDSLNPGDIEKAVEICGSCAEFEPCRRWADAQPAKALFGVVAGQHYQYKW
jgi:hypothetical protein